MSEISVDARDVLQALRDLRHALVVSGNRISKMKIDADRIYDELTKGQKLSHFETTSIPPEEWL